MHSFLVAVSYLTIVPVHFREAPSNGAVAQSRYWYPMVGLLLGVILGAITLAALQIGATVAGAFAVLVAWVALTGAFHLDGCCDLCDGLFGGQTVEKRLAVMKDPHLGTFGLVGGVLVLLGKFAAVQALLTQAPTRAVVMVVTAAFMARCLVLWVAGGAAYPRDEGTGKAFIEGTRAHDRWGAALVAAVAAVTAAALLSADVSGTLIQATILFVPVFLTVMLIRRTCDRRLGGVTGDCLGAAIEAAEVVFLLAATIPVS